MTAKWKVSLSPRYDTYVGYEDLAMLLMLGPFSTPKSNLLHLMPANTGVKRAFFRQMKLLSSQEGLQFVELKESTRDKSWSVYKGLRRKPIGSIMVTYGRRRNGTVSTWTDSKIKFKDMSRTPEAQAAMDRVTMVLTDALANPGVNGYSFHVKVLEYLSKIADIRLPRESWGLYDSQLPQVSYYYVVDDKYLNELLVLEEVYKAFDMKLTWERMNP